MRVVCGIFAILAVECGSAGSPDAGIAVTEGVRADEFRSARVSATIEAAARVVRTRGFSNEGEEWRGFLLEQGTQVRSMSMRTGSCYVVVGSGSSALRELDLRIFDGDGAEVARDAEQGSVAAMRFCPAESGTYFVAARAAAGSGLFAVRELRGPTGLAFRVEDVARAVTPATAPDRDPE